MFILEKLCYHFPSYRRKRDVQSGTILAYYSYVRDVDLHIEQAIQSRDYAVTWLYVLMHVIDAWRPSDIIKRRILSWRSAIYRLLIN